MLLLAILMILAIAMSVSSVAFKSIWLGMIASVGWILASLQSYTISSMPSTGTWDIYYGLFFVGIFLGVLSGLGGYAASKTKTVTVNAQGQSTTAITTNRLSDDEENDINDEEMDNEQNSWAEGMKKHREQFNNMRIAKKKERKWRI